MATILDLEDDRFDSDFDHVERDDSDVSSSTARETIKETTEVSDESSESGSSASSSADEDVERGDDSAVQSAGRKRDSSGLFLRGDPAKRRRTTSRTKTKTTKKPRTHRVLDAYRGLLNDLIISANGTAIGAVSETVDDDLRRRRDRHETDQDHDGEGLFVSMIDITTWKADEKQRFFHALERHGVHNLPALSQAVKTKSIPEIQQYLLALRTAADNNEIRAKKDRLWDGMATIPGAIEIGEECETALQTVLKRFTKKQDAVTRKQWAKTWQEWAVLDWQAVTRAEEEIGITRKPTASEKPSEERLADDNEADVSESLASPTSEPLFLSPVPHTAPPLDRLTPALTLFNVPELLDMSVRIFMNPSPGPSHLRSEENWQTLSTNPGPSSPPSVTPTYLLDILNLIIIYTRRLISTSVHTATSRLRATDNRRSRSRHPEVRRSDIDAACAIIGAKTRKDWLGFWLHAARRNRLRVVETDTKSKSRSYRRRNERGVLKLVQSHVGKRIRYADVERRLGEAKARDEAATAANAAANGEVASTTEDEETSDEFFSLSEADVSLASDASAVSWTTSEGSASPPPPPPAAHLHPASPDHSSAPPTPLRAQPTPEDIETAHLNHLDALATRAEEARLFALLKMPPPASHAIKLEDAPVSQPRARKRPAELVRWDHALTDTRKEESGYVSEWQQFCGEVPRERFEEGRVEWVRAGRRKRRREERLEEKREDRREAKRTRRLQGSSDGTQGDLRLQDGGEDGDGDVNMDMGVGVVADQDVQMVSDESDEDHDDTDDDNEQENDDEEDNSADIDTDDDDESDESENSDATIGDQTQTQPLHQARRPSSAEPSNHISFRDAAMDTDAEEDTEAETDPGPDDYDESEASPHPKAEAEESEGKAEVEGKADSDAEAEESDAAIEPAQSLDPSDYALPAYLSQGIGSIGHDGSDDEYMG